MGVGRLLSFWEGLFSGAILVLGRVYIILYYKRHSIIVLLFQHQVKQKFECRASSIFHCQNQGQMIAVPTHVITQRAQSFSFLQRPPHPKLFFHVDGIQWKHEGGLCSDFPAHRHRIIHFAISTCIDQNLHLINSYGTDSCFHIKTYTTTNRKTYKTYMSQEVCMENQRDRSTSQII